MVERLLAAAPIRTRALPDGETLLMTAARTGSAEPMQGAVARGADVNAREPLERARPR